MKRVFLFLLVNLLIMLTIGVLCSVLGVDRYFVGQEIEVPQLMAYSAVVGFAGSFVSLLMSKTIAATLTGAKIIKTPETAQEAWLVETVAGLADRAGLRCPEVAVYHGSPNAFATGAFKNDALVAVSTGLMQTMDRREIQAVLAHEMSHVRNGDMVTMALLQGVLNTFVFFLSRLLAHMLTRSRSRGMSRMSMYAVSGLFEMVFGLLAMIVSCAFSRRREYRADAGAAELIGSPAPMIDALKALGGRRAEPLPAEMKAFGIVSADSLLSLFSTHPSISDRIAALEGKSPKSGRGRTAGGVFASVDG